MCLPSHIQSQLTACVRVVVQSLCHIWLWDPMDCSTSGFLFLHYLPEFAQIHVLWDSDAIQPSHALPPSSPFAFIFPSIRVFSNKSALRIRWPKYWSFSFNISPSNEYSGLISFRVDWFDLLAAQGALKSLLQHHSSKASILQRSGFFLVQLSHLYVITGKASNAGKGGERQEKKRVMKWLDASQIQWTWAWQNSER